MSIGYQYNVKSEFLKPIKDDHNFSTLQAGMVFVSKIRASENKSERQLEDVAEDEPTMPS
jgi:hypothetical protein